MDSPIGYTGLATWLYS